MVKKKLYSSLQQLYNIHYNLPKYYQAEISNTRNRIESKEIRYNLSRVALFSIGESHLMRKYGDITSQKFNNYYKDFILKPASNIIFFLQEHWNRNNPIETTLELSRKQQRYGLRYLSMANIVNDIKDRKNLANLHCVGIANQANKILKANINNLLLKYELTEKQINKILPMILIENYHKKDGTGYKNVILSQEDCVTIKNIILSYIEAEQEVENIFNIYNKITQYAEKSMKNFFISYK